MLLQENPWLCLNCGHDQLLYILRQNVNLQVNDIARLTSPRMLCWRVYSTVET